MFRDRVDAGVKMALELQKYRDNANVVLGLPRGGVVCASVVAEYLNAPLDLLFVRKIGHPTSPEYAVGAVSENGTVILSCEATLMDKEWLNNEINHGKEELRRRRHQYLTNRLSIPLKNKNIIIVDDGLATGLTMKAAILYAKKHQPKNVVVAVPVAPRDIINEISEKVDVVVLEINDSNYFSVGGSYLNFNQVNDKEVVNILEKFNVYQL